LDLRSPQREDLWKREMDELAAQSIPATLIAICGATGAGKSSTINAVLNDAILPTSGMRGE
jgi:predicted GTPase